MNDKKVIVIVGATGAQGGGLVRAIQNDKQSEFSVRAITRDPNSDKAKKISQEGGSVIEANLDDSDSLKNAFLGAYGAFCVTNFWENFSPEKELQQARNLAEAAKATGLKHVIWSTLEDTRKFVPLEDDRMPTLMGKYKVPHFDAKGEANQFFIDANVPTTFLHTSFYWDNLIHFGMEPQKGEDGNLYFALPMGNKKLPGIAVEDIGKSSYGLFKKGEEYIGKTIGIAGEHLTGGEMATILGKALEKQVYYNAVEPAVYRTFGFPGAEDLGNMFQFNQEFESEFCGLRDLSLSRTLNPSLQSFEKWLEQNKDSIPVN